MTALQTTISEYVRAGFPGLWIQSHEHEDAISEIAAVAQENNWTLETWSPSDENRKLPDVIRQHAQTQADSRGLLILRNPHRLIDTPYTVQVLAESLWAGKSAARHIIILCPNPGPIPPECEKLITVIRHALPDADTLTTIAGELATEPGELPDDRDDRRAIARQASGLTRTQAEDAFSLSLVRNRRIDPAVISDLKADALAQGGLLTLYRGGERFANLGGLAALKNHAQELIRPYSRARIRGRGLLLVGVPGTGKSHFAKALGVESGRPVLNFDCGRLTSKYVGETEERTRQALEIADAMAPAVLFVDEIEKALAGAASGNTGDSGVGQRQLGALLTWLQDHVSDVFVIATSNDVTKLPPALYRSGRIDAVYFLDSPSRAEKDAIWPIYQTDGLEGFARPDDTHWSGCEIRACCDDALRALENGSADPIRAVAGRIRPNVLKDPSDIERQRQWAMANALSAETGQGYTRTPSQTTDQGRRAVAR